jgi:hypothetical protein
VKEADLDKNCAGFVDDYGLGAFSVDEDIGNLRKLFASMSSINYKLGADKILVGYASMTFLGFLLKGGKILPDPEKTKAIDELLPPTTKSQLRAYLGITGYYRVFIHKYADKARPLTSLLRDDTAWAWGPQQQKAFELFKSLLVSAPVLAAPEEDKPYLLSTDFCGTCLSAILEQIQSDG